MKEFFSRTNNEVTVNKLYLLLAFEWDCAVGLQYVLPSTLPATKNQNENRNFHQIYPDIFHKKLLERHRKLIIALLFFFFL